MPTLPDLDTQTLDEIAWWNALEHGASFLDAGEVVTYEGVESIEASDNGVDGSLSRHSAMRFRAKTDGWIVAYMDRVESESFPTDFLGSDPEGSRGLTKTALAEEIDALRSEASNSGDMTFDYGDVGLYSYRYDSDRLLLFGNRDQVDSTTLGWTYRSDIEPVEIAVQCLPDDASSVGQNAILNDGAETFTENVVNRHLMVANDDLRPPGDFNTLEFNNKYGTDGRWAEVLIFE